MKKIYVAFFIFLLAIGISSFSYCAELNYDLTGVNFDNANLQTYLDYTYDYFTTQENIILNNIPYYIFCGNYNANNSFSNEIVCFFTDCPVLTADDKSHGLYSVNNDITYYSNSAYTINAYICRFRLNYNKVIAFHYTQNMNNGSTFPFVHVTNSNNYSITNNIYSVTSSSYQFLNDYNVLDNPSTEIDETNPGGSGGEDEDGEDEDGGILDFITNFWTNLIHIVVPTSVQWDELQDAWQDNILDKFNIQSWSFSSSSLDYNYTNQWQDSSAPFLEFQFMGSTCRIELEYINTLFNMPLSSVLKISKYSDTQTEVGIQYGFNGLTLKNLISFVLAIELTLTNIYLYNKFFNKGGGE